MRLTDLQLRKLKPSDRDFKLSDGRGLYLLVRPSGSMLWRLNYRLGGKQKTLAIGQYPAVSLSEARGRTAEARDLIDQGVDPSLNKRLETLAAAAPSSDTFRAVSELYLERMSERGIGEGSIARNRWILIDVVGPSLGLRRIADIRPAQVLDTIVSIEKSGRLDTARRARHVISAVFRLAMLHDMVSGDPTVALQGQLRPSKSRNQPALTTETELGVLLRDIDKYRGAPSTRAGLLFLAYTFTRPSETRLATWSEFDYEDDVWSIPAERTKMSRAHDVPLTKGSRTILREMRHLYGSEDGSPVFPSNQMPRKPLSIHALNKALKYMGYEGRMVPHGFRASASSILNERGYRKDVIERQLAHVEANKVRGAYNRAEYWDERVEMMRDWSRLLDELRSS